MIENESIRYPYQKVLDRRVRHYRYAAERLLRTENLLSLLRIGVFALFLVFVYWSSGSADTWLTYAISIVLFASFFYLVLRHRQVKKKLTRIDRLIEFAQTDQCRISLQWNRLPAVKPDRQYADHGLASDLNITGPHSLSHLIDTTSSLQARDVVLRELLEPNPNPQQIQDRQKLVASLVPRYLLLAKLRLAGGEIGEKLLNGETILTQLRDTSYPSWGKLLLLASCALALINIIVLSVWGIEYFGFTFTVYVTLLLLFAKRSKSTYSRILDVKLNLDRIIKLFHVLEKRRDSDAPELIRHLAPLNQQNASPTQLTESLGKSIDALSIRAFPLAHILLNCLLPWDQIFTYRIENQRERLLVHFPEWLRVTTEMEAFCALAHFARLHPHYCLPDILPATAATELSYCVTDIGHPLINFKHRVVNDFHIAADRRIGIVTGSNMSGKSAFLRTVGINICLAQAGTVVCASNYRSLVFRLATCINVTDDLENGKSLFYCEIEKLREVLNTFAGASAYASEHSSAQPQALVPTQNVMFLIDEILKGTNNRERILGGERYLKRLLDRSGFGLVSTHDLEFANLADRHNSMFNVHFCETISDGKMVFDHKIKHGKSKGTNALRIMENEKII